MRSKEAANDYRYFPEPDLQPLFVDAKQIELVKAEMPPLPDFLYKKYTNDLKLSDYDAQNITESKDIALYFEDLIQYTKNYKAAANWIMGDVKSFLNDKGVTIHSFPIKPKTLAGLIALIDEGKVSSTIASQKIFPEMLTSNKEAAQIAESLNLIQVSEESALIQFIEQVISENTSEAKRFKNGEQQLIGFFMGQLMRVSKGKADPKIANALLRQKLNEA
jgi:aspartyl-tRNA(Asn)/glutamyl-tRNA(Gln) amidotransferase subunit B